MKNYYDILNISNDSTMNEIKRQYHVLAKKYHPDKNADKNACQNFQKLSEAYQTLSNPKRRALYDLELNILWTKEWTDYLEINLSDSEILTLYNYYESFSESLEIRFLKIMYRTLPEKTKQSLQELWEMKRSNRSRSSKESTKESTKESSQELWDLSDIKEIDARYLRESYHMTLLRSFQDAYQNVCKIVRVRFKEREWLIFITHSNYSLVFKNAEHFLTISIETHPSPTYHIDGYDIHVNIDFSPYKETLETLKNHLPIIGSSIQSRSIPKMMIPYAGLRNPSDHLRGFLHIHTFTPLNI